MNDEDRRATFDASYYRLRLWLSPNEYGERSCNTVAQAKKMIAATGIKQSLKVEGDRK
jgi:hypothetical protein